jgi:hypothetical protein
MKTNINDNRLFPAMILTYGAIPGGPSMPRESLPGGTCFFIDHEHIATAKHIGQIIREECRQASMREQNGKQPYGLHVYDPRTDCTWVAVPGELEHEFESQDISIIKVEPVCSSQEDASRFIKWAKYWENRHEKYPKIRMFAPTIDETLTVVGFTDIEFWDEDLVDEQGTKLEGICADGVIGTGQFEYQQYSEGLDRAIISGWSALGQNSGSPVLDSDNRIVGLVSKSPSAYEDAKYTVIALFLSAITSSSTPEGDQYVQWDLNDPDGNKSTSVFARCDFGSK